MEVFLTCPICRKEWDTIEEYLEDERIIFNGTFRIENKENHYKFRCIDCHAEHLVSENPFFLTRKNLKLLVDKIQKYINNII